jgi:ribose 5-phosphate isomerase B
MRVALGADDSSPLVDVIAEFLTSAGHHVTFFGKAAAGRAGGDETGVDEAWGRTGRRVAEAVAAREHELGVVCCWTGTGISIAANKVPGVRAALCVDAETARGARKWNDANVLALSLRLTSPEVAKEILRAFLAEPYAGTEDESLRVLAALDEGRSGS